MRNGNNNNNINNNNNNNNERLLIDSPIKAILNQFTIKI